MQVNQVSFFCKSTILLRSDYQQAELKQNIQQETKKNRGCGMFSWSEHNLALKKKRKQDERETRYQMGPLSAPSGCRLKLFPG